jgi:hypothetical protein
MTNPIAYFGPLRVLLGLACLVVAGTSPFFGAPDYSWSGFYPTIVAPTLVVLLLFVMPLEMTMTSIFRSDAGESDRRRLGHALIIEGLLYLTLIASWFPLLRALILAKPEI